MVTHRVLVIPFMAMGLMILAASLGCGGTSSSDPSGTGAGKGDSLHPGDLPVKMTLKLDEISDQEIDHFSSVGTFRQRIWYSTEFLRGPDGPVLFYLCGESKCDNFALALADTAKALNAAVVALEHRYYGESLPFPTLTVQNLRFLTIANALEDAAFAQRSIGRTLSLSGKWIAVGGSYAGMLAAFYREKHPELVVGAWASSAPINVALSFWGYDAIVAKTLGPACTGQFQQALAYAASAYDDPAQSSQLSNALGWGNYSLTHSKAEFLGSLTSRAADRAVQYGTGRALCAALAQAQSPIAGLIGYLNPPLFQDPTDPTNPVGPVSTDSGGNPLSNFGAATPSLPDIAPATLNGYQWTYQMCTEVGYFQVPNPDRTLSVMSTLIDVNYWADHCTKLFSTNPAIERTRATYNVDALLRGDVSNIFFVNGSEDPWSSLSIAAARALPSGSEAVVVRGGHHCEDLQSLPRPPSPLPLDVYQAHDEFDKLATAWLRTPAMPQGEGRRP